MTKPKFDDESEQEDSRERGRRAGKEAEPTPAFRRDDVEYDAEEAWKERLRQLGLLKDESS